MLCGLKRGRIKDRSTIVKGLDQAPQALTQLFSGENVGKLMVEIEEGRNALCPNFRAAQ